MKIFRLLQFIPLWLVLFVGAAPAADEIWLLVDTTAETLKVMRGDQVLWRVEGIAIGRGGAAHGRRKGDGRTPKGRYHVAWITRHSKYRLFIGLDYPNRVDAERAWRQGLIGDRDRKRILDAFWHGRLPPQDTPLGGGIGIHGLGRADPRLHAGSDWTQGCIALTNDQIERLRHWVRIGTLVVIR